MHPKISSNAKYHEQIFRTVQLGKAKITSSEFHSCTFVGCDFTEALLHNCRFVSCAFQDCDLSLAHVQGSVFIAIHFDDCKLVGVDWTQADWGSNLLGEPLGFERCSLNHSTFIGLELKDVKFKDCIAKEVDFREAELSGSDLSGTELSGSLFLKTNLSGADLRGARNYHISPGENTLTGAKFSLPEALALLYSLEIDLSGDET